MFATSGLVYGLHSSTCFSPELRCLIVRHPSKVSLCWYPDRASYYRFIRFVATFVAPDVFLLRSTFSIKPDVGLPLSSCCCGYWCSSIICSDTSLYISVSSFATRLSRSLTRDQFRDEYRSRLNSSKSNLRRAVEVTLAYAGCGRSTSMDARIDRRSERPTSMAPTSRSLLSTCDTRTSIKSNHQRRALSS